MTLSETIDPEVLAAFLEEAQESLAEMDLTILTLETHPDDSETLNRVFRAIHSIKGNAPFFGLLLVKRVAHQMESLLSLLREKKLVAKQDQTSALLAGLDLLRALLANVGAGEQELAPDRHGELEQVLRRLEAAMNVTASAANAWPDLWRQLERLAVLAPHPPLAAAVAELQRSFRAVAPEAAAPALTTTIGLAQSASAPGAGGGAAPAGPAPGAESVLSPLEELELLLSPGFEGVLPRDRAERVEALLERLRDSLEGEAGAIAEQALGECRSLVAAVGFVPLLRETLLDRLGEVRALVRAGAKPGVVAAASAAPAAAPAAEPASGAATAARAQAVEPSRSMRVEESKIDEFLDYVGELIITREMFGNVGKRLRLLKEHSGISTEFQRAMGAFTALSHDLQRSIMQIRKVPVQLVLQKVPRLVRDAAEQAGKQARVTLVGGDITVDKSLLESFEAPLVHMVRNAVDHGLETPERRLELGKPAVGQVELVVSETSAEVTCSIRDDGGGIDADALRNKAVRLGLLTERAASQLSREEAFQLVFAAGLSTAKQVTELSGRGVGMDVVKRNVTDAGGRVEISSELGVGSTFTVHLPKAVTVQILDGFLVQIGSERLVLPLRAISESFRPTPDQLHSVAERGECVSRRGRVFPLVRFNRLLGLGAADKSPTEAIVVSVEVAGGRPAGLLVDQVLGVQQVVLREVAGIDSEDRLFAGGAVLGDGRVAMVVDVERLGALVARSAQA